MLSRWSSVRSSNCVAAFDHEWTVLSDHSLDRHQPSASLLNITHIDHNVKLSLPLEGMLTAITLKRLSANEATLITASSLDIQLHHINLHVLDHDISSENDFSVDVQSIESPQNLAALSSTPFDAAHPTIHHVSLNADGSLLALCLANCSVLWVTQLSDNLMLKKKFQLLGHERPVRYTMFFVLDRIEYLISLTDDGSFKGMSIFLPLLHPKQQFL